MEREILRQRKISRRGFILGGLLLAGLNGCETSQSPSNKTQRTAVSEQTPNLSEDEQFRHAIEQFKHIPFAPLAIGEVFHNALTITPTPRPINPAKWKTNHVYIEYYSYQDSTPPYLRFSIIADKDYQPIMRTQPHATLFIDSNRNPIVQTTDILQGSRTTTDPLYNIVGNSHKGEPGNDFDQYHLVYETTLIMTSQLNTLIEKNGVTLAIGTVTRDKKNELLAVAPEAGYVIPSFQIPQ